MKTSLTFLLAIFAFVARAADYTTYDKLDFWLDQYSLFSSRAVVVEPGVALYSADLLNGKVPAPGRDSQAPEVIRRLLLKSYGIEIVLVRDDLAVCRWTFQPDYVAARDAAQRTLRSSSLSEYPLPGRVITESVTLKVSK